MDLSELLPCSIQVSESIGRGWGGARDDTHHGPSMGNSSGSEVTKCRQNYECGNNSQTRGEFFPLNSVFGSDGVPWMTEV